MAAITVICALAAQAVKATPLDNKWLPVICGVLGGVLGCVSAYVIPDFPHPTPSPPSLSASFPASPPPAPIRPSSSFRQNRFRQRNGGQVGNGC